ncbi:hypothetical protein F442_20395, partial [Phytophthora nicotianae P10297]
EHKQNRKDFVGVPYKLMSAEYTTRKSLSLP